MYIPTEISVFTIALTIKKIITITQQNVKVPHEQEAHLYIHTNVTNMANVMSPWQQLTATIKLADQDDPFLKLVPVVCYI